MTGPRHSLTGSYITDSIWLGSFTSMYGPFSLRITTPRTRMVLPEMGGRVVNARLGEFRPSTFGDDNTQVLRVTVARLGVEEDLAGAGATFCPLDEHFHRDRLVDPVDGFHGG